MTEVFDQAVDSVMTMMEVMLMVDRYYVYIYDSTMTMTTKRMKFLQWLVHVLVFARIQDTKSFGADFN